MACAAMPPNSSFKHSSHGGFASDRADVTDVVGMQDLYTRYTDCLPRRRSVAPSSCGRKTIAIIGSTGFLGPYIVASLLKVHAESKVICLNRSVDGEKRTVSALRHDACSDVSTGLPRLQFLVADVTRPDFGLDILQAALLATEMDELIFNAWDTNWSKSLAHFDPFLRAIRNAIDFCTSAYKNPRITFISSICSVGNWPLVHPAQPRVPEEVVWVNRSALPHGYGESKCVAEQLLAKAHEVSGLGVNIVRTGQIGGPSRSGLRMWPRQGWVYSILKASKKLGYFPAHVQALDWIPVDAFADGIANSTKRQPRSETVQVFNMIHPEPAPWNTLYQTLKLRFGLPVKMISLSNWLDMLDTGKLRLHGFLRALGNGREYNMSFQNERAIEVLSRMVPISEDLLAEWLKGWEPELDSLKANI